MASSPPTSPTSSFNPSRRTSSTTHPHTSLSPEEHLSLLSLPLLESTFFRSVCQHRPAGPVKHWAVLAIARDLNSAIKGLVDRGAGSKVRKESGATRGKGGAARSRGSKRKRGGGGGGGGDASERGVREKRFKAEGEETAGDEAEEAGQDEDAPDTDEAEGQDDEDPASEEEEEELTEEDEAAEEVRKLKARGTLQVTPEVVWTKLDVFFNTEGLDELVSVRVTERRSMGVLQ